MNGNDFLLFGVWLVFVVAFLLVMFGRERT